LLAVKTCPEKQDLTNLLRRERKENSELSECPQRLCGFSSWVRVNLKRLNFRVEFFLRNGDVMPNSQLRSKLLRRAITLVTVVSLCSFASARCPAKESTPVAMGLITVTGVATVNNSAAISGQTIFTGSHILTAPESAFTLTVGGAMRLELSEATEVQVEFSPENLSGTLHRGTLVCSTRPGNSIKLALKDGLSLVSESQVAAQFTVAVRDDDVEVYVNSGVVNIQDESRAQPSVIRVIEGARFSTHPTHPEPTPPSNSLSNGRRLALFAIIGGVVAAVFITIVSTSDAPAADFGGCVTTLSPVDTQPPCVR
jgi:hypothetical protein